MMSFGHNNLGESGKLGKSYLGLFRSSALAADANWYRSWHEIGINMKITIIHYCRNE